MYFWSVAKDTNAQAEIDIAYVLSIAALLSVESKKFKIINFKLVILCHFFNIGFSSKTT